MLRNLTKAVEHFRNGERRRLRTPSPRLLVALAVSIVAGSLFLVVDVTPSISASSSPTFSAAADAFVNSGNPSTNYGTRSVLRTDASPTVRSYLRFNVANLAAPVTKATLQVYAKDSNTAGFKVAGVASTTWGETSITYGNAPALGSVVASSGAVTAGQWSSLDVTGLITGNGAVSMALTSASSVNTRYASREAGSTGPKLVVETSLSTTTTTAPSTTTTTTVAPPPPSGQIKNVWVMMMENTAWSTVATDSNFAYVHSQLMPNGAYAKNYISNPPTSGEVAHPSLPNYVRLEAGTNLNITSGSCLPSTCPGNTTNHFSTLLKKNNVSWKTYHENLPGNGTTCPVNMDNVKGYSEDHNAPLYFPDFTNDTAYCQSHERPYTELATDLNAGAAPSFSFIVPNDYHTGEKFDPSYSGSDIRQKYLQQDKWLSTEIPKIMASAQYKAGGAILIVWDETAFGSSDPHNGCIVMSPYAKKGYSNSIAYSHDSTVKSIQEILGVTSPWLGYAGSATDLQDLFTVTL